MIQFIYQGGHPYEIDHEKALTLPASKKFSVESGASMEALAQRIPPTMDVIFEVDKKKTYLWADGHARENPPLNKLGRAAQAHQILKGKATLQELLEMASNPDPGIRSAVATIATNKFPEEAFLRLAKDKSMSVRLAVAGNRFAPANVLTSLRNINYGMDTHLASNPNTPSDLLDELSKNQYTNVIGYISEHQKMNIVHLLAGNKNLSVQTLDYLSGNESIRVRQKVAANPNTREFTLRKLAKDPMSVVRAGVAKNTRTPYDLLFALSIDKISSVVRKEAIASLSKWKKP